MDRRTFLKVAVLAGAGIALAGCEAGSEPKEDVVIRSTDTPTSTFTETPSLVVPTVTETVPAPESTEVVEKASYKRTKVEQAYILDGGKKIEDLVIDPRVAAVVDQLDIRAVGDITNLLIRAIPVDNADKERFPDALGLKFSEAYSPPFEMVPVKDTEIVCFANMDLKTKIDVETAQAIVLLQREAFALDYPIYLAYAYRSFDDQNKLYLGSMDEFGNSGAASPGSSEHHTGLAVDFYTSEVERWEPDDSFLALANKHGFVNSIRPGDRPHFFFLDGIWPGLTKALLDAGIDPNSRRTSVDARIAVFQKLLRQVKVVN